MIRIEIVDPTAADAAQMILIGRALIGYEEEKPVPTDESGRPRGTPATPTVTARPDGVAVVAVPSTEPTNRRTAGEEIGNAHPGFTIAPNDNPAAGTEMPPVSYVSEEEPDAAAIFGGAPPVPSAASVFGGAPPVPNVPPVPTANGAASASAPAPSTNPAPAQVELDSSGVPWDARIHSSNHEKNKGDMKWRAKRGVDPALFARVEAELRQVAALPAVPVLAAPVPNVPATPAASSPNPAPPGLAASLPVPTASGAASAISFAQLLPRVTAATAAGTLTQEQVLQACAAVGLPNLPSLATKPAYVPKVCELLFGAAA